MAKSRDLGWAWKPDEETQNAHYRAKAYKKDRKRKRKKKKKLNSHQKLCLAPGEVFYRSKRWHALRTKVLEKYGYRCMCCGAVDTEIHVDHIKPRSKFPWLSLRFSNLQVLCRDCNMEKSNEHFTDYREKAAAEELDLELLAEARKHL